MGSDTELLAVQREDAGDQERATEAAGAIRESGYLRFNHVYFRIHLAKTTSSLSLTGSANSVLLRAFSIDTRPMDDQQVRRL